MTKHKVSCWFLYTLTVTICLCPANHVWAQQIDQVCASIETDPAKTALFVPAAQRFPTSGTVNALIIFVQHQDDAFQHCVELTGYNALGRPTYSSVNYAANCANRPSDSWQIGGYQSWTDDSVSEWPSNLPPGDDPNRTKVLPAWAEDMIDPPGATTFTPGSLSDFYNRMSNGALTLTGEVWNWTYIPEHPTTWYDANRGTLGNGALKLSHEIISYVDANPYGLNFSNPMWDQYTNGDGSVLTPDGNFDMIILVYRFANLRDLDPSSVRWAGATSVTTLGEENPSVITGDSFSSDPLTLGAYDVIDNNYSGSGVINTAQTQKQALRIIAHEIGHRHFDLYHTDPFATSANSDYLSIMNGSPHLSFSGADRAKIGWANIEYIDVTSFSGSQNFTLRDAAVSNGTETDLIWVRNGTTDDCGDVLIESRLQSTFWDNVAGINNDDDGDGGADFYLPNAGLYISKAAESGFACGGNDELFSSIPNGDLPERRKNFGEDANNPAGMYMPGFGVGDTYSPFTAAAFNFHDSALDDNVAVGDISITGNSINFNIWSDFLLQQGVQTKEVTTFYEFVDDNIAQVNSWTIDGVFEFHNQVDISDNATININSGGSLTFPSTSVVRATGRSTAGIEITGGDVFIDSNDAVFENTTFNNDLTEISNGANVEFVGTSNVTLNPGFKVDFGAAFKARIDTSLPIAPDRKRDSLVIAIEEHAEEKKAPSVLEESRSSIDDASSWVQAYPNPFNPSVTLTYYLPNSGFAQIDIFNVLGQKIKTLSSSFQDSGTWNVVWDGTNEFEGIVPSGTYLYRLMAGDQLRTGKIMFLK